MKIIESDKGESSWEIPPNNMERRARILGGAKTICTTGVLKEKAGEM